MRKTILTTAAILIMGSFVTAQEISQKMAERVAVNFYYEKYNQYMGNLEYAKAGIDDTYNREKDGAVSCYIFNMKPKGFMIVAAYQGTGPILGYGFEFPFKTENQPPNLAYWMNIYDEQISMMREQGIKPAEEILNLWDHYMRDDFRHVDIKPGSRMVQPLLTSLWNQNWPYNYYSPEASGGPHGHAWAGCVAVAYVQVMYYWQFPQHGSGYKCYTPESHPEYGEQCADFENTWYRWEEMCDEPKTTNLAIAELMYQAGVALEMNFGPDGSGAMGFPEQIEAHFPISTDLDSIQRALYTDTEWKNLIINQLDQGLPLGYVGFSPSSGHMWNCDGYQDTSYFHMNWGWGGQSNGYYMLDNLQGFNTYQFLGVNFYPGEGSAYPNYASGQDTLTYFEGNITDGSGPVHKYLNNTTASWLIKPQTETDSVSMINFTVKKLSLGVNDHLIIYDGKDELAAVLYDLTVGSSIPEEFSTTGNQAFISFSSDESDPGEGFYVNYHCTRPEWCHGLTTDKRFHLLGFRRQRQVLLQQQ
ncbi:MAG: C10 family peptidase [Bacteroidota bacterium]|nr:C10 family peptidase [Bacteroidota bacterium]